MSKIYSIKTKTGNRLYNSYVMCEGFRLSDVYTSYSTAKERAYNWCWDVGDIITYFGRNGEVIRQEFE